MGCYVSIIITNSFVNILVNVRLLRLFLHLKTVTLSTSNRFHTLILKVLHKFHRKHSIGNWALSVRMCLIMPRIVSHRTMTAEIGFCFSHTTPILKRTALLTLLVYMASSWAWKENVAAKRAQFRKFNYWKINCRIKHSLPLWGMLTLTLNINLNEFLVRVLEL